VTAPRRIQRSRAKGWKMPEEAKYVGHPTVFANPWRPAAVRAWLHSVGIEDTFSDLERQANCVRQYRNWVCDGIPSTADLRPLRAGLLSALPTLRGKNLACWCALDQPCHADVLLEIANA
jgi:hypothetical protein